MRPRSFLTSSNTERGIAPPVLLTAIEVGPRVEELAGGATVCTPVTESLIQCTGLPAFSDILRGTFDTRLQFVQNPELQCRQTLTAGARAQTFPSPFVDAMVSIAQQIETTLDTLLRQAPQNTVDFELYTKLLKTYDDLVAKPSQQFSVQYLRAYRVRASRTNMQMMLSMLPPPERTTVRQALYTLGAVSADLKLFGQQFIQHKGQTLALTYGAVKNDHRSSVGYKMIETIAKLNEFVFAFLNFVNAATIQRCDVPRARTVVSAANALQQAAVNLRSNLTLQLSLLQVQPVWQTARLQAGQQGIFERLNFQAGLLTSWLMCVLIASVVNTNLFPAESFYQVQEPYTFTKEGKVGGTVDLFPKREGVTLWALGCEVVGDFANPQRIFTLSEYIGTARQGVNPDIFPFIHDRIPYFNAKLVRTYDPGMKKIEISEEYWDLLKSQYDPWCIRSEFSASGDQDVYNYEGIAVPRGQFEVSSPVNLTARPVPKLVAEVVLRGFFAAFIEVVIGYCIVRTRAFGLKESVFVSFVLDLIKRNPYGVFFSPIFGDLLNIQIIPELNMTNLTALFMMTITAFYHSNLISLPPQRVPPTVVAAVDVAQKSAERREHEIHAIRGRLSTMTRDRIEAEIAHTASQKVKDYVEAEEKRLKKGFVKQKLIDAYIAALELDQ